MSRKFLLLAVLIALLARGGSAFAAVSYGLPGGEDNSSVASTGLGFNGYQRIARDSNGFWYVIWEKSAQTKIMLGYTTTTTPKNASAWGFITLVDSGNTGVIKKAPANTKSGRDPAIAIGKDDVLNVSWNTGSPASSGNAWWMCCTNLASLTQDASWRTPVKVMTGPHWAMALDSQNTPHVAGGSSSVVYTKYNTATTAFLTTTTLSSNAIDTAQGGAALAVDLDNNVYVAWKPSGSAAVKLLCSTNAWTTSPVNSTWKNLGQTTTTPDLMASSSRAGPAVTVDYQGVLHLGWINTSNTNPTIQTGCIGVGWSVVNTALFVTGCKDCMALGADGAGNAYAL